MWATNMPMNDGYFQALWSIVPMMLFRGANDQIEESQFG